MMTMERLLDLIEDAINGETEKGILGYSGQYYSPYYQFMYLVAVASKFAFINNDTPLCVELGVEGGRGSNALCISGCDVVGIDNNPDRKGVLDKMDNFTMFIGSSLPVPDVVFEYSNKISLLHIDTEHSFAQAREEFNAYKPYLVDGAVVLFDDTNACEGEVKRFVESLPYEKFFDDRLHPSCGYGGIIYRSDK